MLTDEEWARHKRSEALIDKLETDYNIALRRCHPDYWGGMCHCIAVFLVNDCGWHKTQSATGIIEKMIADYDEGIRQCVDWHGSMSRSVVEALQTGGWGGSFRAFTIEEL
jgi:hypothetical protein